MAIARTAYVSTTEREDLMRAPVTLNGRPACVIGRLEPFATVRTTDKAPAYVGQWAWATVRHVIENSGGAFRL